MWPAKPKELPTPDLVYVEIDGHHCKKNCLKQINQLREQRDRAEKEVKEEKDLHERELTDYKMKIHSLESEVEKLQIRLDKAYVEKVNIKSIYLRSGSKFTKLLR